MTKDVEPTWLPRLVTLSPNQGHKAARAKLHKGGSFLEQTTSRSTVVTTDGDVGCFSRFPLRSRPSSPNVELSREQVLAFRWKL